ncbi:transient receptor potential cation channel protein painless-like [Haematobia irritans]|uniref:transient receptor potential cation channel protein painless-like n=1 Tax=Haematobia irritans TaxID=7368 RepID=UPI003F4FC984
MEQSSNSRHRLGLAFRKRDLKTFAEYIDAGDDPSQMYTVDLCLYHVILSSNGCSAFVEKCLQCPVVHEPKLAKWSILYAAKSLDPEILHLLLPSDYIHEIWCDFSALHYLASRTIIKNVDGLIRCMELLLEHGAIVNMADVNNDTSLSIAMKNPSFDIRSKKKIIEILLMKDPVHNSALRSELLSICEDLRFPEVNNEIWPECESANCVTSQKCCNLEDITSNGERNEKLFVAIMNHHNHCFDRLLDMGADYKRPGYSSVPPLEYAAGCVNSYALGVLLAKGVSFRAGCSYLLYNVVKCFERSSKFDLKDFVRCLDLLVRFKHIDINQLDGLGNTILHHSTHLSDACVLEILKQGYSLAIRNKAGELPVSSIKSDILKAHFDGLIIKEYDTESWKITFDYNNFLHLPNGNKDAASQMEIFKAIAKMETNKKLLEHPLIMIFLDLQWQQLSYLFYLNFSLYLLFVASCIPFILLKLSDYPLMSRIFCGLTVLGVLYLIVRESLQLYMNWRKYVKSTINYMEWLMIVLVLILCCESNFDTDTRKLLCSLTILLITTEFFQLLGSLPFMSLSLRMHMFQMVAKSFLKNFLLPSIFVASFSLCFYIMIGRREDTENDLNSFSNPPRAFVKSIVMMIGELDASDLKLDGVFINCLFLAFVFLVTIVLFNLINGAAIHDILEIEEDAKVNETKQRIKLLHNYHEFNIGNLKYLQNFQTKENKRHIRRMRNPIYLRRISIHPNKEKKCIAQGEWCRNMFSGGTISFTPKNITNRLIIDNQTLEKIMVIVNEPFKNENDLKDIRNEVQRIREKLNQIENTMLSQENKNVIKNTDKNKK